MDSYKQVHNQKPYKTMPTLTILRHGESLWNREKRFTGWTDIDLSTRGMAEAKRAGRLLKTKGCSFDLCFTSYLSRATETLRIVLETMNLEDIPIKRSWRLNERHYGALQGMSWWEAVQKFGTKQVLIWQRHFEAQPPPLDSEDSRFPGHDPRYSALAPADLPHGESLKDTLARLTPLWDNTILPQIQQGKGILIVAHNNSLRALLKILGNIADSDIPRVTLKTGEPLVYELDGDGKPLKHSYLRVRAKWGQWAQAKLGKWIQKASENNQ